MTSTVSVIITTFNRSLLLLSAVQSVLHQTYTDFEVIIIDDGSTDDTAIKLKPYSDRIRYIHQENRGVSVARNMGIDLARGEWIAILDSDDIWLPTKLELQLETVKQMGIGCGVCFTNCTFIGENGPTHTFFEEAEFYPKSQAGLLDQPLHYVLARRPTMHTSSLLIKRCFVEGPNGFDTGMTVSEDTDLLFRLCFKTKFCFVNKQLVDLYRGSAFSADRLSKLFRAKDDRMFHSQTYMYNKWLRLIEGQTDKGTRQTIRNALRQVYYSWLATKLKRLEWSDAVALVRHINNMGDSVPKICTVLLSRVTKSALGWAFGAK